MTRTYNKIQETYMLAKAHLEILEDQEKKADHQFVLDKGITNPDGSIPEYLYCIDDDELFEKASAEYDTLDDNGLWNDILEARKLLKEAEENLIQYGLSIMPARYSREREMLKREVSENYTTRKKFIDLTINLDSRTVTA
jgi:hypothetical protein